MSNPVLFFFKGYGIEGLEDKLNELGLDNKVPAKLQFKDYSFDWLEIHWEETGDAHEFRLLNSENAIEETSSSSGFVYAYGKRNQGINLRINGESFYLLKRVID
ncbi:MAG: hypothetical protein ACKV1O_16090 [Saprospiraceae bacterium]